MPHQCTQCGHTFPDGSKEMLSGCPDCGGNKFQFEPDDDTRASDENASDPRPSSSEEDSAQADARREVASPDDLADGSVEAPGSTGNDGVPEPEATPGVESGAGGDPESGPEDSNMAALRRELDDQFESIKILEPGQYELNLMELYNREEYIIALQEDGQYVIEVPETWLGDDEA